MRMPGWSLQWRAVHSGDGFLGEGHIARMEPPVPASGRPDGKLRVIRVGRAAGEAYPGLRCTPSGLRMPHSGANFCAGRTRDKRLRVRFVFVLVVHNGEYTLGERQDTP